MISINSRTKAVLFGSGYIYGLYKDIAMNRMHVVAIADNDVRKHGTTIDGLKVISPNDIVSSNADIVVLMSDSANAMKEQLLQLGWNSECIMHYKTLIGRLGSFEVEKYPVESRSDSKEKVLIISNSLGYHGVSIVSLRAAKCIKELGYDVTIAGPNADPRYIKEANNCGISVFTQTNIQNASYENLSWTENFSSIIVNSAVMIIPALEIARFRKVMLWIHESPNSYDDMRFWYEDIVSGLQNDHNISIYAVTDKARRNFFKEYRCNQKIELLPVAIEDWKIKNGRVKSESIRFAIIGNIHKIKGQDIAIKALNALKKDTIQSIFFFMIGKKEKSSFIKKLYLETLKYNNLIFFGERSQEEIKKLLQSIDVVIVPSREETFSMVAAEAMMMGIPCIVSDHCGIAEYIDHMNNGMIFPLRNPEKLAQLMEWCVSNPKKLSTMGKNGRKTYDSYFSMDNLKINLEKCLSKI